MADTKITALTELTTPDDEDVLAIVDDPSGTPASRKITVANLGALFAKAIKSADTDVTNSTVLVDVDDMVFSPNVNKSYQVFMQIRCTGGSTEDLKTQFSVPSGAESRTMRANINVDSPSTERLSTNDQKTNLNATNLNILLLTIVNMGATAGDVQLQMAQQISGATTTSILANSSMMVFQLD